MPPCAHAPVVPPLRLRQASLADGPHLARLATQLGYPSTEAQMARRLTALLPRADHWIGVAEQALSGQVVGWLHATVLASLELDPYAEILGLVVDEGCVITSYSIHYTKLYEPEGRGGDPRHGEHPHQVIDPAVLPDGGHDPQRRNNFV